MYDNKTKILDTTTKMHICRAKTYNNQLNYMITQPNSTITQLKHTIALLKYTFISENVQKHIKNIQWSAKM